MQLITSSCPMEPLLGIPLQSGTLESACEGEALVMPRLLRSRLRRSVCMQRVPVGGRNVSLPSIELDATEAPVRATMLVALVRKAAIVSGCVQSEATLRPCERQNFRHGGAKDATMTFDFVLVVLCPARRDLRLSNPVLLSDSDGMCILPLLSHGCLVSIPLLYGRGFCRL